MMMIRFVLLFPVLLAILSCTDKSSDGQGDKEPVFFYDRWTVSDPVLQAGEPGSFDDGAVKDPTIVFYNGNYHLFYTTKFTRETAERLKEDGVPVPVSRSGTGYVAAPTLEELKTATRYNLSEIVDEVVIAPQVFYFEPHKLWYIVAHRNVQDSHELVPIYLTNPDIEDVQGWSDARDLLPEPPESVFWIDFRVICDDEKAHLFFTDHRGSLFRLDCPLEDFPEGLEKAYRSRMRGAGHSVGETVLTEWNIDENGKWRLHEAVSVYYVKSEQKYLALAEAVRPHPKRPLYWDSRNRFMFALVADRIEGPWKRVERHENEFAGDPGNLFNEDGFRSSYDQVSHFTLLRSGYNQKMEIEDFNLQLLFQAFDAGGVGDDYVYDDLPWELAVMRNDYESR